MRLLAFFHALTACAILFLASTCNVFAQDGFAQKYNLTLLNMNNGMPHNFVDDMLKDDHGFVWIATNGGGLCRYDGYSFKTYDVSTHVRMSSNFLHEIAQDRYGRIWISSDNGVNILDVKTDKVVNAELWPADKMNLLDGVVPYLDSDNNGTIWFSKDHEVYAIEFSENGHISSISEYAHPSTITKLCRVDDAVWLASGTEIYKLSCHNSHISLDRINIPNLHEVTSQSYFITCMYAKDNDLWIGTDAGLCRTNTTSGQYKFYSANASDSKALSQNRITDITETTSHDLIIATLKGINIYNPIGDNFEHVNQDTQIGQKSLSNNFINSMLATDDMLWLGTEIGGINILVPNELSITNYTHSDKSTSISSNPVNAIIEDKNGNLWVGNVESGLNMKRSGSNVFEHLTAERNGLVHNSVSALAIDHNNYLWTGTWGNGLCVLDLNKSNTPVIKQFTNLKNNFVGCIVADNINKGVWVSTNDVIYFVKDNVFSTPIHDPRVNNMTGALGGTVDSNGHLWLGTANALVIIDLHTLKGDSVNYEVFDCRLDEPESKMNPRITFLHKAKNGTMYVGTNGYGICYKKPNEDFYHTFTVNNGLANNSVRGITEDTQGNIWASTNCGLSMIEPTSGKVVNYSTDNGLICDNFYWNATYCSPSTGNIYLGTTIGLTEIHRRATSITDRPFTCPTFTSFKILNANVEAGSDFIDNDIAYAKQISMHERDKSFSVEFSALNFKNPKYISYQYRLLGFDTDWIETPSDRRVVTYTNLPPGDYELQVCCTDGYKNWSSPASINIHIKPFFYKTVWFYLLIAGLITFLFWEFLRYRMRNLNEQKRLLHILVKERTDELEKQKSVLEDKTQKLEQQNVILSEQNIKITQQKESIQEMSAKIQKLSVDKLQFFTDISHEIRTPITLIIGPIQRAMKLTNDSKILELLQLVDKNSHDLLQLVNQLMDFRKLETGNMELKPTSGRIIPFVNDIIHPFSVYASERNINVESYFRIRTDTVMYDSDALNKVLTNLLSNAVKYTDDSSRVQMFMANITKNGKEWLYINVRDEGDGIPEDELEKVFYRYYQSDNHTKTLVYGQSGTGIGLYLCRKIAEQAGGTIWAKNNQKRGCSMRMLLPFIEGTPVIEEQKAEIMAQEVEQEEQEASCEKKMAILVVEDNRDMRQYIRTILEEHYDVYEAKDGVDGLTMLAENDIDFIICDLMMPVMDGIEFSTRVKNNFSFSHIPILVLTAQMSDEYRTKSYKIGVESYLHKPFDEQMLLARISGILDGRKVNQQKFQYSLNTDDLNIDKESDDEKFVKKVLELVEKNYMDSAYSIDDILKSMGCSKSMLNKKMQNVIGQSPGVFIRSYRLNVAKQLIILNRGTKNMNISQIAYEVGFNDPKYFTRCFTKHFCVTPSVLLEGTKSEDDIVEMPLDDRDED